MDLSGNTVLITGGTSGIGLAFAQQFLKNGSKVIICGRRVDRLKEIEKTYPGIAIRVADISRAADREDLSRWVVDEHPDLNLLINNAGVQLLADLTKPVDMARIQLEIDTNISGPVHLSSLLTPHLVTKATAAIVNISSGLAFVPLAFMPIYCATKAAIHSLSLSQRYQLKNTSVKLFEIAPPAVDTELGSDRRADKKQSHGGMPVEEFIEQAMDAIRNDAYETAIGTAKNSREKREELFETMNGRFSPSFIF
jgi:uncharacterized oxidoreductase